MEKKNIAKERPAQRVLLRLIVSVGSEPQRKQTPPAVKSARLTNYARSAAPDSQGTEPHSSTPAPDCATPAPPPRPFPASRVSRRHQASRRGTKRLLLTRTRIAGAKGILAGVGGGVWVEEPMAARRGERRIRIGWRSGVGGLGDSSIPGRGGGGRISSTGGRSAQPASPAPAANSTQSRLAMGKRKLTYPANMIIVGRSFARTPPKRFVISPRSQRTINVTERPSPD
jgi:hypothetical protein